MWAGEAEIPTTFPPLARNRYSYTRFEKDSWVPTGLAVFFVLTHAEPILFQTDTTYDAMASFKNR